MHHTVNYYEQYLKYDLEHPDTDYIGPPKSYHYNLSIFITNIYEELGYDILHLNFEHCIFSDFPSEFMVVWIRNQLDTAYCSGYVGDEITKYVYNNWSNDMICNEVDMIKNYLIKIANQTQEEYDNTINESRHKHGNYGAWWLYTYYPLIDCTGDLILKLIRIAYINDVQDNLMDGIYLMDCHKLFPFLKKLLLTLHENDENGFNIFSDGTGAWIQLYRILEKLSDSGHCQDILYDPDLEKIWMYTNSDGDIIDRRVDDGLIEQFIGG
jgi:hypothetical protein